MGAGASGAGAAQKQPHPASPDQSLFREDLLCPNAARFSGQKPGTPPTAIDESFGSATGNSKESASFKDGKEIVTML